MTLRLTDKGFKYTPSFATDLNARFAKMRSAEAKVKRELVRAWTEAESENAEFDKERRSRVVTPMRKAAK